MRISKQNQHFEIVVSAEELRVINQCLREALVALEPDEFFARVGSKASEVETLLKQLEEAYQTL